MMLVSEGPVWELWPGKILLTLAATLVILNTVETLGNIILFFHCTGAYTARRNLLF